MKHAPFAAAAAVFHAMLASAPALAAGAIDEPVTGVTNIIPASFIIAVAAGLILTLVARPIVSALGQLLERTLRDRRLDRRLKAAAVDAIRDFILPGPTGGLIPVDRALRVAGGVVCIQVKHYKGTVFGTDVQPQWTCVDGAVRRRFMNPVIQNQSRVDAIRSAVPELPVRSLVVFSGPVVFPDSRPANVVTVDELQRAVEALEFDPETVAAVDDWDAAWMRLKAAALTDEDSRKDLDAQVSFG